MNMIGTNFRRAITRQLAAKVITGFISITAGLAFTAPLLAMAGPLDLTSRVDRPVVLAGKDTTIYALVRFEADELDPGSETQRPPLNIALVIDRSGSMSEAGKLTYAKRAANDLVDRLSSEDNLALVAYNHRADLLRKIGPVDDRRKIKSAINNIFPDGNTNISGGLRSGYKQVLNRLLESGINRVLLLSDGLANRGIQSESGMKRLVEGIRAKGVTVTSLGLGAEYDEDLMTTIAQAGAGNYYFIESPSQMSYIFDQEIRTLFSTVARDVELRFVPASDVDAASIVSIDGDKDVRVSVENLDDFRAGESRALLLRLDISGVDEVGTLQLGKIQLSYLDPQTSLRGLAELDLTVNVTTDHALVKSSINEDVIVENSLIETGRRQREAVGYFENGEYDKAETVLKQAKKKLLTLGSSLSSDSELLNNQLEALEVEREQYSAAEAAPAAVQSLITKGAKNRVYQSSKGKKSIYLLKPGTNGFEVENLQRALKEQKLYAGDIDGNFDDEVEEALRELQRNEGLTADGIAGPRTLKSLGLY